MTDLMTPFFSASGEKMAAKTVSIDAPVWQVWAALTTPDAMKKWMMPDSEIDILTDWQVGSPFVIRGNLHGINFENKGHVLQFEPEKVLAYSHLSSVSRLADRPENYSVITFQLMALENTTDLSVTLRNFPTESIYKHLLFYWNATPEVLKQQVEAQV